MRIAESIERNGLDVQMAHLERIVGAAVAVEAETGEPVAQRLAEAVVRFDWVFVPQKTKLSARQFVREIQFRRRAAGPIRRRSGQHPAEGLSRHARRELHTPPAARRRRMRRIRRVCPGRPVRSCKCDASLSVRE
jgi:hypothetical protein